MYAMWYEAGTASRSGPSRRSNQRSRSWPYASGALVACHSQLLGERSDRDALLLLVSLDRIDGPRELGRELVLGAHQLSPSFVEAGGRIAVHFAELLAVAVRRQDGEPGLCRPERDLFALERDALGEDRVLECVLALRELLVGNPGLALLAQAIETLGLVAVGLLLGRAERIELLAAEEVGVRGDDRGPLGDLLLAHAHGADLFGTLEEVGAEPLLVLRGAANCCDRHRERESTRARRILRRISDSGPRGLACEQALDRAGEILELERLADERVHTVDLHRIGLGGAAEEAHGGLGARLAEVRQQLETVVLAHMHVEQHDVDRLAADELDRLGQGLRLEHVVLLELEVDAAEQAERGIILNDQHDGAPHTRV